MIIAIDFDGTIVNHDWPRIGKPRPHAIEVIKVLQAEGHRLILWTCRDDREHQVHAQASLTAAKNFLLTHGIEMEAYNKNAKGIEFGQPKIYADVYIDDRCLMGLPPWPVIYQMLSNDVLRKALNHEIANLKIS